MLKHTAAALTLHTATTAATALNWAVRRLTAVRGLACAAALAVAVPGVLLIAPAPRPAGRVTVTAADVIGAQSWSGPPAQPVPARMYVRARHRMIVHRRHVRRLAAAQRAAELAAAQAAAATATPSASTAPAAAAAPPAAGIYSYTALEQLWVSAGGPAAAEAQAARIAECESGGNPRAQEPSSGAAGLWQILGQVVAGDLFDPVVNAENAVSKYRASGNTFAQWVCQ